MITRLFQPRSERRFAFEAFVATWRCPRCGARAVVFNLCHLCHYETFGRWMNEHAIVAARMEG